MIHGFSSLLCNFLRKVLKKNPPLHNHLGFRSTPVCAGAYKILVVGDCNIWGVNLNDYETIPWQLSNLLKISVFNGGRTAAAEQPYMLEALLKSTVIKNCSIIVEFVRDSILDEKLFKETFSTEAFKSYLQKDKSLISLVMNIPIQRYFFPCKLWNNMTFRYRSLFWPNKEKIEPVNFKRNDELINNIVKNIKSRADFLQQKGYRYIFVPLPTRDHTLSEDVTGNPSFENKILVEKLKVIGIESVDLYPLFDKKKEGLFIPEDSHIGPIGAEIIAQSLSTYLKNNP